MKLSVEKWLETINPSANVRDLFGESVLCYKIGAYRASLLYSYLAFLTILKERLVMANKPANIPEGMWNDLIRKIQREDKWEESVYESTQNSSQVIFQIPEHIRLQIKYWKDRRNDCAHYKDNEINEHHVEALWSFIKSNLSKITVDGGMESLLGKFSIHFDSTKTKPGSDFSHLIADIPASVELQEISEFLENLYGITLKYLFVNDEILQVFEKCIQTLSDAYIEKIIRYLHYKSDLYVKLLLYKPSLIQYFNFTPAEIRELWSDKMRHSSDCLGLLAALLRAGLIPENEIDEALERIAPIVSYPPEDNELDKSLWHYGFYKKIYDLYFSDRTALYRFKFANNKADIIMHYIELKGLDDLMVERICLAFNQPYNSYNLGTLLNRHFTEYPKFKADFLERAHKGGWPIPKYLTSLSNAE
jgi:hypothetical protein